MKDFSDDQNCFVCGKKNAAGLQLEFQQNPRSGEIEAQVVFPARLQGWQDTVHGGLLATVLDETMIKAAAAAGSQCLTAEISVKYKKPALTGSTFLTAGKILETRGRIITAQSRICDSSGTIYAQASGKLFKI
ncbi:MAG: PaaI family thioesterase [Chrysiogenia bacterium]